MKPLRRHMPHFILNGGVFQLSRKLLRKQGLVLQILGAAKFGAKISLNGQKCIGISIVYKKIYKMYKMCTKIYIHIQVMIFKIIYTKDIQKVCTDYVQCTCVYMYMYIRYTNCVQILYRCADVHKLNININIYNIHLAV